MSSYIRFSKRIVIQLIPFLGYAILALIIFWPAVTAPEGQMIFGDDIHRQYYFYRQFFNAWIHAGVFPWWNPYVFGGEPFIANPVTNIWYPPTWLFTILKLPMAYVIHLFLHVLWACYGMYVLLRGKGQHFSLPAWIGGVIFGLSGFFMARTFAGHVDVIAAASWMPWVVWRFGTLCTQTGSTTPNRDIVLASVVFAFQLFAGYQTMAFFTVILIGFVSVSHSIQKRSIRPITYAALAGLGGVLLAAVQILPEQEFFRQSIRTFVLPYSWISYGSLTWQSFVQLVSPFYFGNQYTYNGPPPNFIEHSMYIGIGGLLLVFFGIITALIDFCGRIVRVARRGVDAVAVKVALVHWFGRSATTTPVLSPVVAGIIVVFGFWISLGPNAPVDLQNILWNIVPMYHYLRIPPRHIIIAIFGLSILSAYGFRVLGNTRKYPIIQWIFALIVTGELVMFGKGFITTAAVPETRHDQSFVQLVLSGAQEHRLLQNYGVWLPQRDGLDFDSVMKYGIFSATGYDPSILKAYFSYIAESTGMSGEEAVLRHDVQVPYLTPNDAETLDRLAVKYIQVPDSHDPFAGNSRYRLVMDNSALRYRVYENSTVRERFYLRDPYCGTVSIRDFTPNTVRLSVSAICDSQLDTSDVWYPGWVAYVDNKKIQINKLNNVFRTINVSRGNHEVIFVYSPDIFVIGGLVSLLTCIVMGVVWRRGYFRGS